MTSINQNNNELSSLFIEEITEKLHFLAENENLQCWAWETLVGGEAIWHSDDATERAHEALTLAAVKCALPYGSKMHQKLSRGIADIIGCRYCTYPWITQTVAHVVSSLSYGDLVEIAAVSKTIRH